MAEEDNDHGGKIFLLSLALVAGVIAALIAGSCNSSVGARAKFISWTILLLSAPIYTIAVVIVPACHGFPDKLLTQFVANPMVPLFSGYIWVGTKIFLWARKGQKKTNNQKLRLLRVGAEVAAVMNQYAADDAALKNEREQRQAKLDALRAHRLEEREGILKENKELLDQVAGLISTCDSPVSEMLRATKALSGEDVVRPPEMFFIADIMQIILRIGVASGSGMAVVARLFAGMQIRIAPSTCSDYGANEALQTLREFTEKMDNSLEIPAMVPLLASYDELQGTHLASKAAEAYLLIVEAASACCGRSVAVKMIADTYAERLKPFVVLDSGNTNAGKSGATSGGPSDKRAACAPCVKSYRILDLPLNSGPDAVKSKRRAFVEFLHPDQLGSKTEQARRAAEEQLKNVNEACDHILRCRAAN